MDAPLVHFRFTADEYEQMIATGILTEEDRVELLEGEIIAMSPTNVRHAACVKRLNELLSTQLARRAIISIQDPIRLDNRSQPEPDVALLRRRPDYCAHGHPEPEDIILAVEVADTSLAYDRDVKTVLYARGGIEEYWLINLMGNSITVYRQPEEGIYRSVQTAAKGESVSPLAFPDVVVPVDAVLG